MNQLVDVLGPCLIGRKFETLLQDVGAILLITQFGQDVEGYTALISQLLQMHSTNDLGKSIETEATSPNQCSLSIKKNTQ